MVSNLVWSCGERMSSLVPAVAFSMAMWPRFMDTDVKFPRTCPASKYVSNGALGRYAVVALQSINRGRTDA